MNLLSIWYLSILFVTLPKDDASGFGLFQFPLRCHYVKVCRGGTTTTTTTTPAPTTTTSTTAAPSFSIMPRGCLNVFMGFNMVSVGSRNNVNFLVPVLFSMRGEEATMDRVSALDQGTHDNDRDFWIRNCIGDKKFEDEYLLGDVIGRGASSVVYKCLRKGRTEFACKVLKKSQLKKESVQAEIGTLLKLKHPNIVQLKEVFETREEIQLILELAHGGELFERIVERGQYSEEDAARSVRHILNALQYLHANGIIHKDLKPENLLYQTEMDDSVLKLADYGMSKLLADEPLAMSKSCGAFGYSAPEILLNKDYDSSIDLWSLGVVTYIMLCGFEPFWDEEGEAAMMRRIVEGNYSFPSPWWDEISESAKDLIFKLLTVDPKNRPTAEEALDHPWTLGMSTPTLHMNQTILRLREFNARRRFRVATKAVLATRRALNLLSPKSKTVCGCLTDCPTDVRTNESEIDDVRRGGKCCDCCSIGGSASSACGKTDDSFASLPPGGSAIGKLSTDLYKENVVGLN